MAAVQAEDVRPLSCVWLIWMAIIKSGWVLQPRIVMVWPFLTTQLCLVAISWIATYWRVAVVAPIGNSDHSYLATQWHRLSKLYASINVFSETPKVNWNIICSANKCWKVLVIFIFRRAVVACSWGVKLRRAIEACSAVEQCSWAVQLRRAVEASSCGVQLRLAVEECSWGGELWRSVEKCNWGFQLRRAVVACSWRVNWGMQLWRAG